MQLVSIYTQFLFLVFHEYSFVTNISQETTHIIFGGIKFLTHYIGKIRYTSKNKGYKNLGFNILKNENVILYLNSTKCKFFGQM